MKFNTLTDECAKKENIVKIIDQSVYGKQYPDFNLEDLKKFTPYILHK